MNLRELLNYITHEMYFSEKNGIGEADGAIKRFNVDITADSTTWAYMCPYLIPNGGNVFELFIPTSIEKSYSNDFINEWRDKVNKLTVTRVSNKEARSTDEQYPIIKVEIV